MIILMAVAKGNVKAQKYHLLPQEIKKAYQKGTRSHSGYPGINYWQNRAKYKIEVELLAEKQLIIGQESITYFNNSPDSLDRIVLRLYPDLFKKGNARDWTLGADAMTKGTLIEYLFIDNDEIDLSNRKTVYRTSTNLHIMLNQKLLPGDSLVIKTKWQFDVPATRPVRTGLYGDDIYFIAYWYPQVAVYDDIDGWDNLEYLGTVEYYNDFNDYEVQIKVPEDFKVWATGTLQNEDEIYLNPVLKKLEEARSSDEVVNIFSIKDCKKGRVLQNEITSWDYKANQVPDFTFACSKYMNWEGSMLVVDSLTNQQVFVDAVYPDSARTYNNAALWTRQTVAYLSYELPGYPFPYEHMTTFSNNRRGGGMESPMMANNGDPSIAADAAATVFHEIAHTYFPFFMGTNERKYAWMDEGWAAYLPSGFMEKYYPEWNYFERRVKTFEDFNGKEQETSLMVLSYLIAGYQSYRHHAYNKSSMAYAYLHDALGDSTFKAALHAFIVRWKGKHPIPYDFFNTFSNVSGQSLDWFFIPWFFERAQADLAIKKATMDNKIVVENIGGLPLPIVIKIEFEDNTVKEYHESTSIWSSGNQAVIIDVDPSKKIRKVTLGSDRVPDINKTNNELKILNN